MTFLVNLKPQGFFSFQREGKPVEARFVSGSKQNFYLLINQISGIEIRANNFQVVIVSLPFPPGSVFLFSGSGQNAKKFALPVRNHG